MATKSQRFPIQQARASNIEVLREAVSGTVDSDNEDDAGMFDSLEFITSSGDASPLRASTEELHDLDYWKRMEEEYKNQFMYPMREVNLARPHEYQAMVTARLSGKIGEIGYTMLVDSGSELNIMTLQQAQDLALPIDDSRNSWTLKSISGHTMGLEGICWSVPVKIRGIEFSHNFFITCSDLGNKDMVLGQPWLFSHSTRIDYIHDMGVILQLWEKGDQKGHLVLINLPLVKAPHNVMPISLCCDYKSYSMEQMDHSEPKLTYLGSNLKLPKLDSEKSRPVGPVDDSESVESVMICDTGSGN